MLAEPEFQRIETEFGRAHCHHFDDTEENKFIYTDLHKEYVRPPPLPRCFAVSVLWTMHARRWASISARVLYLLPANVPSFWPCVAVTTGPVTLRLRG